MMVSLSNTTQTNAEDPQIQHRPMLSPSNTTQIKVEPLKYKTDNVKDPKHTKEKCRVPEIQNGPLPAPQIPTQTSAERLKDKQQVQSSVTDKDILKLVVFI